MINFANTTFVKSAPDLANAPQGGYPEVLLVGRSNVGKSSLINALCRKKALAFTSSKPGHTRLLNYYDVDHQLYLVDAPGYGYAKGGFNLDKLFQQMMDDYFSKVSRLKRVLVLLDSRRELNEDDIDIINYLIDKDIKFSLIFTKVDKVNQSEKYHLIKSLEEIGIQKEEVYFSSTLKSKTLEPIRSLLTK